PLHAQGTCVATANGAPGPAPCHRLRGDTPCPDGLAEGTVGLWNAAELVTGQSRCCATGASNRGIAMDGFTTLMILPFLVQLYLLPALVALTRRHHNAGAIFLLNLFLGWTLVGWVVALVWAATQVYAFDDREE